MGFLSFPRYSFESVFRNRRRSLFAIIGIVIALSLLSGSWIAVDSSARDLLESELERVLVDFQGNPYSWTLPVNQSYFDERTEAIEGVKNIERAEGLVMIGCHDLTNGSSAPATDPYSYCKLMFLPERTTRLLDIAKINGTMPDFGTAAIPKQVAADLDVTVGDDITFVFVKAETYYDTLNGTYLTNYTYRNVSVPISQIWTQGSSGPDVVNSGWGHSEEHPYDVNFAGWGEIAILNLADLPIITTVVSPSEFGLESNIQFYVWIDRDAVISLANLPRSVERIRFIGGRLNMVASDLGMNLYSAGLESALEEMGPKMEGMKVLFAAVSLPVIGLGTYLSIVGVDLGVNERRREVGILKSRGASNRQVFSSLIMESLLLGTISGFAGLLAGVLVSRGLANATAPITSGSGGDASLASFTVSPYTVLFSVIVGILLMLAASYRPLRRMSRIDVAEALHRYSPHVARLDYKPKWDLVSLSLVVLSAVSIVFGTRWVYDSSGSWIFQLGVLILFAVGVAVFPFMPFLLSFSIVRLLTRGSRKLYAKFTLIVKPWTKELHHLVDRNIVRNPRRASNLCVIISLALTFGLFISVTVESSIAYELGQVKFELGSDVRIESSRFGYASEDVDLEKLNTIGSLPGVRSSVAFNQIMLTIQGQGSYAAKFDASDYRDTARPSSFYFEDGGPGLLDDLEENGTVLVTKQYADRMYLMVGDRLNGNIIADYFVNSTWVYDSWDVSLRVIGIVKALPGFPSWPYEMFIDDGTLSFISESNLTRCSWIVGCLLSLDSGVNATAVGAAAASIFSASGLPASYVGILDERVKELRDDPGFAALSEYLYAEYAFSVTIMTVGVGLLIFVAVTDREQELACIMARGSSGSQMRKILMGESLTLMVIGLVVGVCVGMLTAYMFNVLSTDPVFGVVERRLVVTYASWLVVLASVVALLVASLLATARAGRIKLAEVLRVRGG